MKQVRGFAFEHATSRVLSDLIGEPLEAVYRLTYFSVPLLLGGLVHDAGLYQAYKGVASVQQAAMDTTLRLSFL